MTDLAYQDIRPILAKVGDLGRDLVLVGGQAVNFWAHVYEHRVPTVARDAPFTSKPASALESFAPLFAATWDVARTPTRTPRSTRSTQA